MFIGVRTDAAFDESIEGRRAAVFAAVRSDQSLRYKTLLHRFVRPAYWRVCPSRSVRLAHANFLGDQLLREFVLSVNVGEALIATLVEIGQLFMIEADQAQ
jgi:hypothetical protein